MKNQEQSKLEEIAELLATMEYGSLQITVHQGQITQIDKTEKKRYQNQITNKEKEN